MVGHVRSGRGVTGCTAHMADHSLGAAIYAIKAVDAAGVSKTAERAWQLQQAPDDLRDLVVSALNNPRFPRYI